MKEHMHKCSGCELYFGCCEESGSIFGDCPHCAESRVPLIWVMLILAGLTIWVLVMKALL